MISIKDIQARYTKGETVQSVVESCIAAIKKDNETINAVLEIFPIDQEAIKRAQTRITNGTATALTGIPILVKDNIVIKGHIASAASKMLENYKAPYTATAMQKLLEHDPIIIGRTNMDEFAMGGSNENSAFGPVKNPHDTSRVSGGSSGGSAAAVAAGWVPVAIGSDTGGSVRQPASFCGIVGLKPSYGAVSRYGLMAMGSSLDQIGPITTNIEDAETVFNAIKGKDIQDATTRDFPKPKKAVKKLGVPWNAMKEGVDKDVMENFKETLKKYEQAGYEIVDVSIPAFQYVLPVYYIVTFAEVSSNMARYDGVKYGMRVDADSVLQEYVKTRAQGLGREVKRRIILGTYVLSAGYYDAYYGKAQQARALLTKEVKDALQSVDAIVTPTSPFPAFKIGERSADPLAMYVADIFTVTANLTGLPAISIPSGTAERDGKKLPLGIQFTALEGGESTLFEVGKVLS